MEENEKIVNPLNYGFVPFTLYDGSKEILDENSFKMLLYNGDFYVCHISKLNTISKINTMHRKFTNSNLIN